MREFFGMLRAGWLGALSYRMNLVFSLLGLVLMLTPVYFLAEALQPLAANSIAREGGHYLGFLIAGIAMLGLVQTAMMGLQQAISSGIGSGTLEAMLATPARLPGLVLGLISYECSWALVRLTIMFGTALALGVRMYPGGIPTAVVALLLTLAAYFGIGLALAGMILVFRTIGPLGSGMVAASALLGGAYYSTTVIPSWIQKVSLIIPLSYGLRAFRQALLAGAPLSEVWPDLAMVAGLAIFLLAIGAVAFTAALNHARRQGTLGQY